MKEKLSLAFAHNSEEMNYIIEKSKHKLIWVPLNLENLLFFKSRELDYIDPIKILKNKFHKECTLESERLLKKIGRHFHYEDFIKTRYLGVMRKYFASIFFVVKLLEKINTKIEFENIYLSGWDSYNFHGIKGNFFISRIIYNIFKKDYKIILIDELSEQKFYKINLTIKFPKINNKKYFFLSSTNYNFFRIVRLCFKNNFKILTICESKMSTLKKIFFKTLGVNFIFIKEKKLFNNINNKNKIKKIFPRINYKYKKYNFSKVLNSRIDQFFTVFPAPMAFITCGLTNYHYYIIYIL